MSDVENLMLIFEHYDLMSYYCEYNHKKALQEVLESILDFSDSDIVIEDFLDVLETLFPSRNHTTDTYDYVDEAKIQFLKECYQPEQKSEEWYKYRNNLITASSAWKILHSPAALNEYIYSKCKPFDVSKYFSVNVNSPFHWGNKYEDVSVALYETLNDVSVTDFGCIKHSKYDFLGASPDGIVTSEKHRGRMLEIKNIVNREITGIPKKEYWIQMQLQMEVCDLNDCDFLECRFKEYDDEEAFKQDGTFSLTKEGKHKGIMIHFFDGDQPIYKYAPFGCSESVYDEWQEKIMTENKSWIKTIYWYLEEFSCIHIKRNKIWFDSVVPVLEETWGIIKREKINGYLHRKPKSNKKVRKEPEITLFSLDTIKNIL